ncbi:MAG: ABC transporter permease [Oscillospiraceae bacterium]|nr:ABC transporter permease [Oscillospiraceae bacterium]
MKALKAFTIGVFIFLYLPIAFLIVRSFDASSTPTIFTGFTLDNYRQLAGNSRLMLLLQNSLIVAFLAATAATILGTMAAMGIVSMRKKMRGVVMKLTRIPITNPDIVTGVSLAIFFVFIGRTMQSERDALGFGTLLIAHITFNLPYVILAVMPKLRQLDPHISEAARDLGCTPFQSFRKVVLPEIFPGILGGFMMAFVLSLDDFVISFFVHGPSFVTLPVEIYSYTKRAMPPPVYAMFTLLFLTVLAVMVLINLLQARSAKYMKPENGRPRGGLFGRM